MADTIFALSSGSPPAAIAVVRISGPHAGNALEALAGELPQPRVASYRTLRDNDGTVLDRALVLWFEGPGTATGEDLAELHLHGGRAVVAAVEDRLAAMEKLRRATPGEFTRRAFANGRIDLAEAEGLADLLSAETELQRRNAVALAGGALSREAEGWRERLLRVSARVEAALDFSDEGDVVSVSSDFGGEIAALRDDLTSWLAAPRAETLREGFRVVIAGPPNAGKSSLFNRLIDEDAAITSAIAGTTRDVLLRPVALSGLPFTLLDTAGIRDEAGDEIEAVGVGRARAEVENADLVLWLGPEGEGPDGAWEIDPQCDRSDRLAKTSPRHRVSALTGEGLAQLRTDLVETARQAMPRPGQVALNARQHMLIDEAARALDAAAGHDDLLLLGEELRVARTKFDALLGQTTTEDMLDALFGRFCIGK